MGVGSVGMIAQVIATLKPSLQMDGNQLEEKNGATDMKAKIRVSGQTAVSTHPSACACVKVISVEAITGPFVRVAQTIA